MPFALVCIYTHVHVIICQEYFVSEGVNNDILTLVVCNGGKASNSCGYC